MSSSGSYVAKHGHQEGGGKPSKDHTPTCYYLSTCGVYSRGHSGHGCPHSVRPFAPVGFGADHFLLKAELFPPFGELFLCSGLELVHSRIWSLRVGGFLAFYSWVF
ncbi:LOW QUALITY PROTEIN: hypothetical protein TorRG33x02_134170 [Trema orientale]|uniref:Uncharacterized protein n=1 Tax=Trema orientale TaxID=63057 RepID=A0A2P5EZ25_TREOI|nr:LOW QUALITY PROTEIN: hypothetical protein TorRG33x02_134170 [Trema orientale]